MSKYKLWIALVAVSHFGSPLVSAQGLSDEYRDFQRSVQKIISSGREIAVGRREQSDLRTLQFLSNDLDRHVAAGDAARAKEAKRKMEVALQRSQFVVADGPRRKAEWERQERERRHRNEMRQRERQHQELINEIRRN